jgi:hypothetical protein
MLPAAPFCATVVATLVSTAVTQRYILKLLPLLLQLKGATQQLLLNNLLLVTK